MLYTLLYMSTRTQIYLTEKQRMRLDDMCRHEGKKLAELVREAVDQFLDLRRPAIDATLDKTFGVAPHLVIPSRDEWDRNG